MAREKDEVDREIIEALTDFRDTLRARTPLATRYTVRQLVGVVPPPQFGPEDVKKVREELGVSQPIFADLLGTSTSTIRSWEQGQKSPSPMARRFLSLIAADPIYWKSRFFSMTEIQGDGDEAPGHRGELASTSSNRASGMVPEPRGRDAAKKSSKRKRIG